MALSTGEPRVFLVVIDDSPEMSIALDYAARRAAASGGRVALFYAIEPQEISPWRMVEQTIEAGEEQEARRGFRQHEEKIEAVTGRPPILYIRRGSRQDALVELLEEQPSIALLVLGAGSGKDGPGPLISFLTSAKGLQRLKIPLVVVPQGHGTMHET